MSRLAAWSVFALGLAAVAYAPPGTLGQAKTDPKDAKKVDPKVDPKKTDPKKVEPKQPPKVEPKQPPKVEPKQPPKVEPKPADPDPVPDEPEPLPVDGPPNPLELVAKLRQDGLADLAVELVGELAERPALPPPVKAELPLERAKCLLEAADDEPDEATRLSLVGEAKDGFETFLKTSANHPRAAEAYLSLARLSSLAAKAQLVKARRIDVPADGEPGRDEALGKQKAEAKAARPLFETASKQFKSAADKLGTQLAAAAADPATRRTLLQAKMDAELASGINQVALGDTYIDPSVEEVKQRSEAIEKARKAFADLITQKERTPRIDWVAKAWMAECEYLMDKRNDAKAQFDRVLAATGDAAEDGKRVARYFLIRHKREAGEPGLDKDCRDWLAKYGTNRRAQSEAVAVRWYLASSLHGQADAESLKGKAPAKGAIALPPPPPGALGKYREAEKQYRTITQTDNEYTARATKRRMMVVRRILGEADKAPAQYKTFEDAQMASLIQMSKLFDEERLSAPDNPDEAKKREAELAARRLRIVALLEHARDIATEKDNPADVTEVLIRLIYFYQQTAQPQRAAVLGEYVARYVRATGGKASAGGMLAVGSYARAAAGVALTDAADLDAVRRADRERAIRLARFLDDRFPNDTATDAARHQLAGLLYEDGRPVEAYDATLKVRPGYERLAYVRLFQGAVASQLLTAKDSPLAPDRRVDVFRRTLADLEKLPAPPATATDDDARTYLSARARLAFLSLMQSRVDPESEKAEPGTARARRVAEEAIAAAPAYPALRLEGGKGGPNLDGWEAVLAAEDARTRAVYIDALAALTAARYDAVFEAAGKVLTEMNDRGPLAATVKAVDGEAAQKARVEKLADGVDKLRRDLVVVALKTRVQQGQADKGGELLDLLKKFGGSVEASVPTLEQLTLDINRRIEGLRRAGKADEAKAVAGGFGQLLEKVSAEPNLPAKVQLFLGQALIVVGEYGKAEAALARVPRPGDPKVLASPASAPDDAARTQATQYRRAALDTARARRLGKNFGGAEALLREALGEKEKGKEGWGANSLDFRKEWAYLHEDKALDQKDLKAANKEWAVAVKEWSTLLAGARGRYALPPPKDATGNEDNAAVQRNKNAYYDAFLEYQRCLLKANTQLLAADAAKLQDRYNSAAKVIVELETRDGQHMYEDVRARFHDLMGDLPAFRKAYEAAGGKLFLRPPGAGG
jgi:hypothetical protein